MAQIKPAPNTIGFRQGALTTTRNLQAPGNFKSTEWVKALKETLRPARFQNRYFVLLQFDRLPGKQEKEVLASKGIRLYDYLPGNAWLAETPDSLDISELSAHAVSSMQPLPERLKIADRLASGSDRPDTYNGNNPPKSPDELIAVTWFGSLQPAAVKTALEQAGAHVEFTKIQPERTLFIQAGKAALEKIAALPFISSIGLQSMKAVPLNYTNRAAHGFDALNAPAGRNLQGDGVVVGIGDNSDPYTHADFTGRLIERFPQSVNAHGTHTAGIIAGGGIIDPLYRGMAPHATLVSQLFSDILVNTPVYVKDYNMVLTNNSYASYDPGCSNDGAYDALSNFVDLQEQYFPTLLHSFASGNDGYLSCSPFPNQYATVKSGYQTGKNILTVGNVNNYTYSINSSSSAGPCADGRLKPEMVAGGVNITSTYPYNTYGTTSGTSMSCPTVTGALALLYQRYRQLHSGADPAAALLKTILCNSATDLGNPGPDFLYGFGTLNARAAAECLEGNQYITGTVQDGGSGTFTLTGIPAGLQQVKIMLYWPDVPAAPFAATALVNDLDLTVSTADGTIHHPLILNPDPAHVTDIAVEGIDRLNNIEQVVVYNPPSGNCTITISGAHIPAGPQAYVVAWQYIRPSVTLEYPYGNETWVPGQQETIRWNAYGSDANPFTIEYSPDNGNTWSVISSAVPGSSRMYTWTVPATATNQALIRITRNGTGYQGICQYNFTVLGQPATTVANPCQGYAQLSWNAVPSATGYEIMQLHGDTMAVISATTATNSLIGPLSRDSSYWFAVRAVNGSGRGRRSIAVNVQPGSGPCNLTALNNDLTVDSLFAPHSGRLNTSSQLSATTSIQIEVKNLGTIPTSGPVNLFYQINGGPVIAETSNTVIPGGGTSLKYNFSQTADLSAAGTYAIQAWVQYPGDPQSGNDTIRTVVSQLANDPLILAPNFTEGFENSPVFSTTTPSTGLPGLDRFDFSASSTNGRVRNFINSGFARTGNRCAILDQGHYSLFSSADSLTATFNLSRYSSADQLWLDFWYRNQGIDFSLPGNRIWIRGNDQAAWIPVYTLDTGSANFGIYQPSASIDITGILAAATPAQTISSSFQVRFGEQGFTSANSLIPDGDIDDGYLFDDITLTRSSNDLGLRALINPNTAGVCSLPNNTPISVLVRNYSGKAATNIPVSYRLNGTTVTESIPLIPANDSLTYTFRQTADLSAYRNNTISAWVSYPGDNYARNDTLLPLSFQTTPLITTYPYLEGFESNNGYWYTDGINDSWQWGTPAKKIINRAANGSKCWVTSLTGNYNNSELSYLYSPCFDLSSLANPVLSFSHIFRTEDNCDCDYHWVEYSVDGIHWTPLGYANKGVNWYDNMPNRAWQQSYTRWHVSSYDIPVRSTSFRFRFVMKSDPGTNYEGVGIDDVHIFDKAPVYTGPSLSTGLDQPVSGSNWIDFSAGGTRILSINPNGQDLGNTHIAIYNYTGPVRNDGIQYYLNRNLVIQPANPPDSNVSIRYYFTDQEADSLILARGCDSCATVHDAYQAGITQYSSPALAEEDSTLSDNRQGTWHYLLPHRDCSIIPYDNGYYAEYQVSGFSEFWINTGTPGPGQPLPLALLNFTATRSGNTGILQWTTVGEKNTSRFRIEKSADGSSFLPLDSLKATGDSGNIHSYRYTDYHLNNGSNYYRLKIIATDNSYLYSPVRLIRDSIESLSISFYPNPVRSGLLYISSSVNARSLQLTDVSGRIILRSVIRGFFNSIPVEGLARGVYFLQVQTDAGSKVGRILVR